MKKQRMAYTDAQGIERSMTQDDRWLARYQEVMAYVESNKRNPSMNRVEKHMMLNWVKANRKLVNAGLGAKKVRLKWGWLYYFVKMGVDSEKKGEN